MKYPPQQEEKEEEKKPHRLVEELEKVRSELELERRRHEEQSERALAVLKERDTEIARLRREEIEEARVMAPPQPEPPIALNDRARAVTPKVYDFEEEDDVVALQAELERAAAILARDEYIHPQKEKKKTKIHNHQFLVRSEQMATALDEVKKELNETKNRANAAATGFKARIQAASRDAAARRDEADSLKLRFRRYEAAAAAAVAHAALEAQRWRENASRTIMLNQEEPVRRYAKPKKQIDRAIQVVLREKEEDNILESQALVLHNSPDHTMTQVGREELEAILSDRDTQRQLALAKAEIHTLRQDLAALHRQHGEKEVSTPRKLAVTEVDDSTESDDEDEEHIAKSKSESLAELTLKEREDELRNYQSSLEAMENYVSGDKDKSAMCAYTATLTVRLHEEIGSRGRAERRSARLKQSLEVLTSRLKRYEKKRGALKAALAAHAAQSEAIRRATIRHRDDLAELRQRVTDAHRRESVLSQRYHDATEMALNGFSSDPDFEDRKAADLAAAAVACAAKARLETLEALQRSELDFSSREAQLRAALIESDDAMTKLRQTLTLARDRAACLSGELKASQTAEKAAALALVEARATIQDQMHRSVDFDNGVVRPLLSESDDTSTVAALRESRRALARLETRLELVEARSDLGGSLRSIATVTTETQTIPMFVDVATSPFKKNQVLQLPELQSTPPQQQPLAQPPQAPTPPPTPPPPPIPPPQEVSAVLVLRRLRQALESAGAKAAETEMTPELKLEASALFEVLGGDVSIKEAEVKLREGLLALSGTEEATGKLVTLASTLLSQAAGWKERSAALRLQLLAQKRRHRQIAKNYRSELRQVMHQKRQEIESIETQNKSLKARLAKFDAAREDNRRRSRALAEVTERLSHTEAERDEARTERDQAQAQRTRALARAAALSHSLKAQQQHKSPTTPTSSLSGVSSIANSTATTTRPPDERPRTTDPLQRERLQALKRRNADAEARATTADAKAAEFCTQRDAARAAVKMRDTALRVAKEQLTKLEAHLNLIKDNVAAESQKKQTNTSTQQQQQQQRSLVAAIKTLAVDLGHGLVRARQRSLVAPADSASMVAASVLDLSPHELVDLLAELDDDPSSRPASPRVTKKKAQPPEVTAILDEVSAAIGPPLDQNRLRNTFNQVLEDRLQLERELGASLGQSRTHQPESRTSTPSSHDRHLDSESSVTGGASTVHLLNETTSAVLRRRTHPTPAKKARRRH